MEDELAPAGGGINVLGEAFKADALFLKAGHRGNEVGE